MTAATNGCHSVPATARLASNTAMVRVSFAPFLVDGLNAGKRFGRVTNGFDLLMQGRLIVLELNDQMGIRGGSGFEGFFGNALRRR